MNDDKYYIVHQLTKIQDYIDSNFEELGPKQAFEELGPKQARLVRSKIQELWSILERRRSS